MTLAQTYKYIDTTSKRRFTSLRTAAKASGLTQVAFKSYLGTPGFPFKKIMKPRAGGGMGLFGTVPRAPRRRRLY